MNSKGDLSFHAYIRGIILFGFALLILGLIITGNIKYYIAPKMMPFIYFSVSIFLLLGVIQIFRSTKKGQSEEDDCDCGLEHQVGGTTWVKVIVYSIFILPLLMGFIIPDLALNSSVAANRGVIYGSGKNQVVTVAQDQSSTPRADQYLNDREGYLAAIEGKSAEDAEDIEHYQIEDFYNDEGFGDYYDNLMAEIIKEPVIKITEENYLDIMVLLDIHLEQFIGKELEVTGFVFREPDFKKNRIVVARFSMTCCTADAGVYGILVESDEAYFYEDDLWIKVRGTITKTEYNNIELPVLQMREVTVVTEPDSPYVYPSFQ